MQGVRVWHTLLARQLYGPVPGRLGGVGIGHGSLIEESIEPEKLKRICDGVVNGRHSDGLVGEVPTVFSDTHKSVLEWKSVFVWFLVLPVFLFGFLFGVWFGRLLLPAPRRLALA